MPSVIYNSFFADVNRGNINPANDAFRAMLVTADYVENKAAHRKRSSVVGEVTGPGYVAGGVPCALTVVQDDTLHRIDVVLGAVSWPNATLVARKLVVYKARGGAAALDELVACIEFPNDVAATNATLSVSASTIRTQN